jgi:hypothetical protein
LQNNISRKKIRSNEKYLFVQRKVSMIIWELSSSKREKTSHAAGQIT